MYQSAAQGYSLIVEDIGVLDYLLSKTPDPNANMKMVGQRGLAELEEGEMRAD